MSEELKQALAWALKQEYPSCGLPGLYARTIAREYVAYMQRSAKLETQIFTDGRDRDRDQERQEDNECNS